MEILSFIISGLALLAATVCLVLLVQEKKHNAKRNAAALQFSESLWNQAKEEIAENIGKLNDRVGALESGAVPDYEEQRKAAKAVNDFARGLSGILGFDPMEALRKERNKNLRGTEDE